MLLWKTEKIDKFLKKFLWIAQLKDNHSLYVNMFFIFSLFMEIENSHNLDHIVYMVLYSSHFP